MADTQHPDLSPGSNVLSVDDAVSALIQNELGFGKPKAEPKASLLDAVMLAILTLNVALLFSFAPSKAALDQFENGWFVLLSDKVLPWIASAVFVAGYTWWKDQVLRLLHLKGFRAVNVALGVVLVISQVPLIPFHVQLTPENAELWLDGERIPRSEGHWGSEVYEYDVNVRFGPHDFDVKPPRDWHVKDPEAMEQSFHFSLRRMFGVLPVPPVAALSIVWPVTINAPREVGALLITRKGGPYGTDFLNTVGRGYGLRPVGASETTTEAVLSSLGQSRSKKIYLPAGEYQIVSKTTGCQYRLTISNEMLLEQYPADLTCGSSD